MPINVCDNAGFLGGLSISPRRTTVTKEKEITYTITVDTKEIAPEIDGEFRIESDSVQTGDFDYIFSKNDIKIYSIKENEKGFTFKFNRDGQKIVFKLVPRNFYNPYEAALVVDAVTAGYGNSTAELKVDPEFEIVQADNISDYPSEVDISPEELEPPPEEPIDRRPGGVSPTDFRNIGQSEKFIVKNEYNYYSKEYEETKTEEVNLLNINKNFPSIDVRQYYSGKQFYKSATKTILQPHLYTKEIYPKIDKQKFLFPMYMEIKFETDITKAQLSTFLHKIGMIDYFCYFYIFHTDRSSIDLFELKERIKNTNIQDADLLIQDRYQGILGNINNFKSKSFQKTILLKVFEKQLKDIPDLYKDEILMYKVSKTKNNVIINEQYFTNDFDTKDLFYFDSQLKYDTEYAYKVSKIQVSNNGTISEIPIKSYEANIRIVDSPPLPPDVLYIPFKGVDNQIMINFNASSGRYADYPVIIKDSDKVVFNKILENSFYNRLKESDNKVQFETDDAFGTFELYRIDFPPNSYEDFKNSYEVQTQFTSLLDDIEPNKKYYYISRIRDVHGNLSNPTKPIEIQMINENGTIYLLKKEHVFGDGTKEISKKFKNIIQIRPSKEQMQINKEFTYDLKPNATSAKQVNLVLGKTENSVWGKQFLMRITSKTTGKKIDVKFKFTYSKPN